MVIGLPKTERTSRTLTKVKLSFTKGEQNCSIGSFLYCSLALTRHNGKVRRKRKRIFLYRGVVFARILIADGSDVIRKLLKALIESHPDWLVCGEAVGGHDAVAKTRELKPDLVILDLAMADLNGLFAAREILKSFPSMPILLHTVHNIPAVVEEAKRYGIRQVIGKGEGGEQLLTAIQEHLESKPHGLAALIDEIDPTDGDASQDPDPASGRPN